MATSCGHEFQAKFFGFNEVSPDMFQRLQWTENRWLFSAYRFFMAAFVVGWFLYGYLVTFSPISWTQLSSWSEGLMVVNFLYAFGISIHALVNRRRKKEPDSNTGKLPWYYILNWLLFATGSTSAFEISLFYWVAVAPSRTAARNLQPVTFHIHVTNSILTLIDIFMVAYPTRWLHFIYTILFGVLYTIFLLILHFSGYNSAVYSQLNFQDAPGVAAGWTAAAVLLLPVVLHSVVFGFYHLRALIARKTVLQDQSTDLPVKTALDTSSIEMGKVNPTFEDSEQCKEEGKVM